MVCPNLNNYNTIQILMALFKKKKLIIYSARMH